MMLCFGHQCGFAHVSTVPGGLERKIVRSVAIMKVYASDCRSSPDVLRKGSREARRLLFPREASMASLLVFSVADQLGRAPRTWPWLRQRTCLSCVLGVARARPAARPRHARQHRLQVGCPPSVLKPAAGPRQPRWFRACGWHRRSVGKSWGRKRRVAAGRVLRDVCCGRPVGNG